MPRRSRDVPEPLREPFRSFAATVARVERAKADLLASIPAPRRPGVPLAEALLSFREGLEETAETMPAWRAREVEDEWRRCADGIGRALELEEALRLRAPVLAHDALLFALQDLIAPLEPFEEAARRFRELRR